jgi:four helix bundle protein
MRKRAERFEDLEVWQYAHKLVLETYKITRDFPGEEKFGLTSQMRRAGVSIAAKHC